MKNIIDFFKKNENLTVLFIFTFIVIVFSIFMSGNSKNSHNYWNIDKQINNDTLSKNNKNESKQDVNSNSNTSNKKEEKVVVKNMICSWITLSDKRMQFAKDDYYLKSRYQIDFQLTNNNGSAHIKNAVYYWDKNNSFYIYYNNMQWYGIWPLPINDFYLPTNTISGSLIWIKKDLIIWPWENKDFTFTWLTNKWNEVEWWNLVLVGKNDYKSNCIYIVPLDFTKTNTKLDEQKILNDFNNFWNFFDDKNIWKAINS